MENKILISLAKKGFDTEIRDAVQGYIAGMNDSELLSFEQSLARSKAGSKRTFTKNTIKFAQWYYEKTGTYIFPVLQSNGIDLDTGLWRWWMVSLVDPCIVVGSCELSKCVKNLDSLVLTFNANSVDVDCPTMGENVVKDLMDCGKCGFMFNGNDRSMKQKGTWETQGRTICSACAVEEYASGLE